MTHSKSARMTASSDVLVVERTFVQPFKIKCLRSSQTLESMVILFDSSFLIPPWCDIRVRSRIVLSWKRSSLCQFCGGNQRFSKDLKPLLKGKIGQSGECRCNLIRETCPVNVPRQISWTATRKSPNHLVLVFNCGNRWVVVIAASVIQYMPG